jgi:predicted helicase
VIKEIVEDTCKKRVRLLLFCRQEIILDPETSLKGLPAIAWDYKLGNRSALEWILDQYQEKNLRVITI